MSIVHNQENDKITCVVLKKGLYYTSNLNHFKKEKRCTKN